MGRGRFNNSRDLSSCKDEQGITGMRSEVQRRGGVRLKTGTTHHWTESFQFSHAPFFQPKKMKFSTEADAFLERFL